MQIGLLSRWCRVPSAHALSRAVSSQGENTGEQEASGAPEKLFAREGRRGTPKGLLFIYLLTEGFFLFLFSSPPPCPSPVLSSAASGLMFGA